MDDMKFLFELDKEYIDYQEKIGIDLNKLFLLLNC